MTEEELRRLEDELRKSLRSLADDIKSALPPGFGFALLVCASQPGAALLYVANLQRGDVLQMMREFIATNREERVWQREMPDVELQEEFVQWWEAQLKRKGPGIPDTLGPLLHEWARDAFNAGRASA